MQVSMVMTPCTQKKITKEKFEKIMANHQLWLTDRKKGKRANLSDTNLEKMDLAGMDFSYAILSRASLFQAKLSGANLSHADLSEAFINNADLTDALVEGTDFTSADLCFSVLDGCKGNRAHFLFARMWDCKVRNAVLTGACFLHGEVFDCDFTESDLEKAYFACADMDNSVFKNTNLKDANFSYADRTYWSDFSGADMTGAQVSDIDLDPELLKDVKGLYIPMCCPEEGSFIAWKKCRAGKVVKLLIPETAERKGSTLHSCRASEAKVLEIFDEDGNPCDEAISIRDKDFKYVKGELVVPKASTKNYGDVEGIYFVLSRAETDFFKEKEDKKGEDKNEEYAE